MGDKRAATGISGLLSAACRFDRVERSEELVENFCALPEGENAPRVTPMNDERIVRLEEKVAYLERHVTAQDKVMLELSDLLARVRAELKMLRERANESGSGVGRDEGGELRDERPPHY